MDRLNTALGLALALSIVAAACAAPAVPNDGPVAGARSPRSADVAPPPQGALDDEGDVDGGPLADGAVVADGATPAPTATPAPGSCAASADYDTCFACCDGPTGGALAAADDAVETCSCGGGACTAVCGANYCNGQKPSPDCNACLTSTCDTAAATQCTTAACQAGKQCLKNDCAGKN